MPLLDTLAKLYSYTLVQIDEWLRLRLHGTFDMEGADFPRPDPRDGEWRCDLVITLLESRNVNRDFKKDLCLVVSDALYEASVSYPEGRWTNSVALNNLIHLVMSVASWLGKEDPASSRYAFAQTICRLAEKMPFESDNQPLKRSALLALIETGLPPDEAFWRSQWDAAVRETPPWTGFAGVVFEGIYRGTHLKAACQWMATAEPLDVEVMCKVLDRMLPIIIADLRSPDAAAAALGEYLMLPLRDSARRKAIRAVCKAHGLDVWVEVFVPQKHRYIISRLMRDSHGMMHADMSESGFDCPHVLCSESAAKVIQELLNRHAVSVAEYPNRTVQQQWALVGEAIWVQFQESNPRAQVHPHGAEDIRPGINRSLMAADLLHPEFEFVSQVLQNPRQICADAWTDDRAHANSAPMSDRVRELCYDVLAAA